jgi:hypothetical protein
MSRPQTTFDSPQFNLLPDNQIRDYANVNNHLEFLRSEHSAPVYLPTVVPTALFILMKDVFKIPLDADVMLYMHRDGEYYVFGIGWTLGEDFQIADLWLYGATGLPGMFRGA